MQEAQICLNEEEMPKDLLPINKSNGIINPIRGPATYHGQGCLIQSGIQSWFLLSGENTENGANACL